MCGIFAISGAQGDGAKLTLIGLKTLEYRGYDSWGIAEREADGTIRVDKHTGKIGQAETSLPPSSIAIGHTRWATHGGATVANAHPHLNTSKTLALVHNGIVENFQTLKESLVSDGYTFVSETDTEVIVHLIDQAMKSGLDFPHAVSQSFNQLTGSNAIVVLDAKSQSIMACRDGSPLIFGRAAEQQILASDSTALLSYTSKMYFLQDGESICYGQGQTAILYDTKSLQPKTMVMEHVDGTSAATDKAGYAHYTLKEIYEQPTVISRILQHSLEPFDLHSGRKIIFTGCGSAYHVSLFGQYLAARAGKITNAIPANEIEPYTSVIDAQTDLICISQSGETADVISTVKLAKSRGARITAIVNARGSTLERLADRVIPVGAGPEIAVLSTKAMTAQVATLYTLLSESLDLSVLNRLGDWLTDIDPIVKSVAQEFTIAEHVYVIGKYEEYPVALETALKMKEAAYVHTEAFAAGELKHGVLALVEPSTLCIVCAHERQTWPELLSSTIQLKSRGARIVGITPFTDPVFDVHIQTHDMGAMTTIPNIIAGQLLSYHLSVRKGLDPDKPRNLAKSVTVK